MQLLTYILLTTFLGNFVQTSQYSKDQSVTDTIWGQQVSDPYRSLEDIFSSETASWIEKQNSLAETHKGKYYQDFVKYIDLYNSIDYNPLTKEGRYYFYFKIDNSQKASVLYYQTKPELTGKKLFDPSSLDKRKSFSIDGYKISPDQNLLALILSEGGSDWKTIKFLEISTGKILDETLNFIKYSSIYWSEHGVFYVSYDEKDKKKSFSDHIVDRALYYHHIGTSQNEDILVYAAKHKNEFFEFEVTPFGKYLVLMHSESIEGVNSNVVSIQNLPYDSSSVFRKLIVSNKKGDYYNVIGENGDRLLVESNSNVPNGAIFSYNLNLTNNREIFINPYSERLEYAKMLYNSILRIYNNDKQSFAVICNMKGEQVAAWSIPEGYTFSGFSGCVSEKVAIYHFSSFFSPGYFYQIDLETFERKPLGKTTTFFDIKDLTTQKVWYRSADSTLIPMYLTHLKSFKQNGKNPALLYGYGGFGISMEPFFDVGNLIFLKNGGIIATPALRGGGDFKGWHEQGKRLNKQNTFDDFIAAAEYLIAENYAHPNRIAAMGGSNGGLVVGAAMVQRPDLFKVVVSRAGLFDMLRYHQYNIGYTYANEYGNANDSTDFVNLYKYSPYHNVKQGVDYPATLLVASDNDDRVNPFHSFKFLSQLQEKSISKNPYILYYEENAGHSGSPVYDSRVNRNAFIYSFIFSHLDMDRRIYFNFYED